MPDRSFNDIINETDFRRYEFVFSNNLGIYDAWKISEVTEELIALYYKAAVIHALAKYGEDDFDLFNIVISDRSVDKKYFPTQEQFEWRNQVELIYRSRLCFSLMYNPLQSDIIRLMDIFEKINSVLYRDNNKKTIFIEKLTAYYNILRQQDLKSAIQEFQKDAFKKVNNNNNARRSVEHHFKSEISKFEREDEQEVPVKELEKLSMEQFFEKFNNLRVPIVAFVADESAYHIICHRHLKGRNSNDRFDVRKIVHESPTVIEIAAAVIYFVPALAAFIGVYGALIATLNKTEDAKKKMNENQEWNEKHDTLLFTQEQAKIIAAVLDEYSLVHSQHNKEIYRAIGKVKNEQLKSELHRSWDLLVNKYATFIELNQLYPVKAAPATT